MIHLINFSHPLTADHLEVIARLADGPVERVVDVVTRFDPARSFAEQAKETLAATSLTAIEWQTTPLLVNPPSFSPIAALVLAELHGRMGYFPAILRLRSVADTTPPRFEVAEIINLQAVRDRARQDR